MSFGETGHSGDQNFHDLAGTIHYIHELRTLFVPYPLGDSALTGTTDNLFDTCPTKLTDTYFVLAII